jgi:Skp family chaperone for outer membrane proteins
MKKILAILFLCLFLIACSDKAADMYELAEFEEIQNNPEHAVQLYEEIIEKYPDSPQAKEAAERLDAIASSQKCERPAK